MATLTAPAGMKDGILAGYEFTDGVATGNPGPADTKFLELLGVTVDKTGDRSDGVTPEPEAEAPAKPAAKPAKKA